MTKDKTVQLKRRAVLHAGLAALTLGVADYVPAQQKIAQNLVQYQDKPKGDAECDKCMHFVAPGSCKVVDGKISPKGWCAVFAVQAK